jgi:hypothetical protein
MVANIDMMSTQVGHLSAKVKSGAFRGGLQAA